MQPLWALTISAKLKPPPSPKNIQEMIPQAVKAVSGKRSFLLGDSTSTWERASNLRLPTEERFSKKGYCSHSFYPINGTFCGICQFEKLKILSRFDFFVNTGPLSYIWGWKFQNTITVFIRPQPKFKRTSATKVEHRLLYSW